MGLLPYMGGDAMYVDKIIQLLPPGEIFIEVFGGGGSVSLEVAKRRAYERVIWNDKDRYLYAVFYYFKHDPDKIIPLAIKVIRKISELDDDTWFWYKRKVVRPMVELLRKEKVKNDFAGALIMTILHHAVGTPFQSGLMRRVTKYKKRYSSLRDFMYMKAREVRNLELMNKDCFDILNEFDKEGVVMYMDPPHVILDYYRLNFTEILARRLSKRLVGVRNAKILLKLSPVDLPYYHEVRRKWKHIELKYKSMVSSEKNKKVYHFFMNYEPPGLLSSYLTHFQRNKFE